MSVRVPRRGTGTEAPGVARKALEWGWSAGVTGSSLSQGSTRAGRNLMEKAKPFSIAKREVWAAYQHVKANQGTAGVDGQSSAEVERDLTHNLDQLWNRLSSGRYFPPPVRRVEIPKGEGRTRPLGLPTGADRIAQTVVKRYLEPEVEKVFHPDSSGYRPGTSGLEAVGQARERCWRYDGVARSRHPRLF